MAGSGLIVSLSLAVAPVSLKAWRGGVILKVYNNKHVVQNVLHLLLS